MGLLSRFLGLLRDDPTSGDTEPTLPTSGENAALRAGRLEAARPRLYRGAMKDAPRMTSDRFDLGNMMIAVQYETAESYLLDGKNISAFIADFAEINAFVAEAEVIFPDLPDLRIEEWDTAFVPIPDAQRQAWRYTRMINEGLTPTGERKKHPISIYWETIAGSKSGRFYYDADGVLQKGHIREHYQPDKPSYSIDFIGGKLSHIWEHTESGKRAIYNKNKPEALP